jgi:hypothetical protein
MAIIDLVDKVCKAVDTNKHTIGIFLDLSKAFDTIDHNILLSKLMHYGFRGIVLNWFKSYLSNRMQYVYYNGSKSRHQQLLCGVPQGSILGPLLFIMYINDIVNTSSILDFVLFADDTTILYSHDNISSKLNVINKELAEVTNWFKANKLSVNAGKTNYMLLGTHQGNSKYIDIENVSNRNDDPNVNDTTNNQMPEEKNAWNYHSNQEIINIVLDDRNLQRVRTTKFLGVIVDENLSWKHHIDGIAKTIARNIGMINKLKDFLPERILYSLYCTLILPYINYSIQVWGNTYRSYLDKIFKLQKWALRTISNSHYRSHTGPLFNNFNILNVYDTYKLEVGVFMFKHFKNQLPETFDNFFTNQASTHDYDTRNTQNYTVTRNKKVFSDQSIRTTGPILWNSLSQNFKMSKSVKHFKKQFKNQLVSHYL